MKIITLAAPTVVNSNPHIRTGGELRYPSEGPLTVSDDEAKRLKDNNLLDGDPENVPDANPNADLVGLKPAELKVIALKEGAPLNDATKADDMIAAIVAHRSKEA
ncbi:hypothetical protein C8J26_2602 [Sphingomonas aurantiaca]|uniref:Uncharacterized protein n=1 Tax=Sphingomonas aurantiaca TaxID=185949 RepID=A0A2T5GKB1_9SPHN|nr:hypothetical protein [Sphingomonas aurantiaca]PTQ59750.1 hypothetical protein C8J26_2602 [Sphingomonas aurantiaca]